MFAIGNLVSSVLERRLVLSALSRVDEAVAVEEEEAAAMDFLFCCLRNMFSRHFGPGRRANLRYVRVF